MSARVTNSKTRTSVAMPSDSDAAFRTVVVISAQWRTSAMLVIEASCTGVGNTDNDIVKETQMQKHERIIRLNLSHDDLMNDYLVG